MKKSTSILSILFTLIITALWFTGSWWYYTCKIKNTCKTDQAPSLQAKIPTTTPITEAIQVIDTDGDGLSDDEEKQLGTDPLLIDTDTDSVPDNQEVGSNIASPLDTDQDGIIDVLDLDDDNDGLSTFIEEQIGSSPLLADTDEDGVLDLEEVGNKPENPIDTDEDGIINALDTDDDDDGISTSDEILLGTNPLLADTDGDGLSDLKELGDFLDKPLDTDTDGIIDALDTEDSVDQDGDGLTDVVEAQLNTNPKKADTDGDGINDLVEVGDNTDSPLDTDLDGIIDALDITNDIDSDNDGLTDAQEKKLNSNPNDVDSDKDGINDNEEIGSNIDDPLDTDEDGKLNINDSDDDNDGLNTRYESEIGTNPLNSDTDGDTISDFAEIKDIESKVIIDSDKDGLINPVDPDDDNDGLPSSVELVIGTNPLESDSDADGISDYDEVGTDYKHPLDTDKDGIIDAIDTSDDTPIEVAENTQTTQESEQKTAPVTETTPETEPKSEPVTESLSEEEPNSEPVTETESEKEPDSKPEKITETVAEIEHDPSKINIERIGEAKDDSAQAARLYFPFNVAKPNLSTNASNYFSEIVEWMKQSPDNTVNLTGHTDNIGPAQANLAMGIRRVMVIREMLIELGAPFSQFEVLSRGESQPIETNDTKAGRFKNRRVEITPVEGTPN